MSACIIISILLHCVFCNIIQDPGFELPVLPSVWQGFGGSLKLVTDDVYRGRQALKAFNRTSIYQGLGQDVHLKPGSRYKYKAHIKQLNDKPGILFQTYKVTSRITWPDNGPTSYLTIAVHRHVRTSLGWFVLEGDFMAPNRDMKSTYVYIEGLDAGIDYLVDEVFLEEFWKMESNELIQKNRRNNIEFIITHDAILNAKDITLEIDHKRHLFGFGARVNTQWMIDPSYSDYQDVFYYLFDWGTVLDFDWPSNKTAKPDYSDIMKAAEELHKHGLKVRAQSPLNKPHGNILSWLQHLDGAALNQTVQNRIQTITSSMVGHVDHWDVFENTLDSQFYEEKTGDPNYSEKVCKLMHEALPSVDLFIADDNVLVTGLDTAMIEETAERLKAFGLGGIGASAFFTSSNFDPVLVKMRLDSLAAAGLPVWISGLDISEENEDKRADMLERALHIFFGHPAVEGVTIWNFWSHENSPNSALFEDFQFEPNAAGWRYLDLIKHEWSTHVSKNLSDESSFTVDGFHGDYDVTVFYKGKPIMQREMHLGKSDLIFELHITGNGDEITIPTTLNPIKHSTHYNHLSYNGQYSIGQAQSTASNHDLRCQTRWSKVSAVGDDKMTSVSCQGDEILTGCSSFKQDEDADWHRDGEFLETENGKIKCTAINGYGAHKGVIAVATCCSASQLKCDYRMTGFSENLEGSFIATKCPQNYIPTGCSSHNWDISMHGARPLHNEICVAENGGGTSQGVQASAACCSSPGLTCTTVRSAQSGPRQGETANVTCIAGHIMTGCNFLARDGKSAGAYLTGDNKCVAINGNTRVAGQEGVVAVAVCCKIDQSAPVIG